MAHYAKIENGLVVEVIVADEEVIQQYDGKWLQTSYNTIGGVHYDPETGQPSADQSKAIRKNYAGIGFTYDYGLDAFVPPRPVEGNWVLNEQTCLWEFVE